MKTSTRRRVPANVVPLAPRIPYVGSMTTEFCELNLLGVQASIAANVGNRPKRMATVREYAMRMVSGLWDFTLPTIVYVCTDGTHHNGQHSRYAFEYAHKVLSKRPDIANSKAFQEFLKKRLLVLEIKGLSRQAAKWIDSLLVRTAADQAASREDFKQEFFADLLGKNPDSQWATLFNSLGKIQSYAEGATWKRICGKLPRTSIGKVGADMTDVSELGMLRGYSIPAAEYAVRASLAGKLSLPCTKKKTDKNGAVTIVDGVKTVKTLSRRVSEGFIATVHMLACSAYGRDGLAALDSIVALLSSATHDKDRNGKQYLDGKKQPILVPDLHADATVISSGSPALTRLQELLNSLPINSKGNWDSGSNTLNAKFVWLLNAVRAICKGAQEGESEAEWAELIGDESEATVGPDETLPPENRLGGLDLVTDYIPSRPSMCLELVNFIAESPEPDIFDDDDGVEPSVEDEHEFGESDDDSADLGEEEEDELEEFVE